MFTRKQLEALVATDLCMCDINPFNLFTGKLRKCGNERCSMKNRGVSVDYAKLQAKVRKQICGTLSGYLGVISHQHINDLTDEIMKLFRVPLH